MIDSYISDVSDKKKQITIVFDNDDDIINWMFAISLGGKMVEEILKK